MSQYLYGPGLIGAIDARRVALPERWWGWQGCIDESLDERDASKRGHNGVSWLDKISDSLFLCFLSSWFDRIILMDVPATHSTRQSNSTVALSFEIKDRILQHRALGSSPAHCAIPTAHLQSNPLHNAILPSLQSSCRPYLHQSSLFSQGAVM